MGQEAATFVNMGTELGIMVWDEHQVPVPTTVSELSDKIQAEADQAYKEKRQPGEEYWKLNDSLAQLTDEQVKGKPLSDYKDEAYYKIPEIKDSMPPPEAEPQQAAFVPIQGVDYAAIAARAVPRGP